ncbi:hypothetical protein GALMADRAFT_148963 [Galerina marginata CBS 339.88]|uniref:CxC2-like cysteine cluster KDZ transposase-associated domain-containing protein n=1 Tax=Galerina marginata (strain CBS 339.88) TaxID=685588 RepID=A0A067S2X5_GALM3|nr:hypothetical protein GALMADRAFT_148963 [Galerina marginata CBS 339.88]
MPPKPSFKKHKEDAAKGLTSGQVTQRHQTRQVESTIIAGSSTVTTKSTLPLPPQPLQQLPRVSPAIERLENAAPPTDITDEPPNVTDEPPKTRTQASKTLSDFQDAFPKLLDFMFEHHADAACGSSCRCQRPGATNTTRCYDCQFYPISCSDCFIESHACLPSHWAEVWDSTRGFFVRHDIATLKPDIASVNLGHGGIPCSSAYANNLIFDLVDINGIHKTKIRFCYCRGSPDRSEQLMRARLFPATITQPTTAFTFQVLHQFHIHHLESKESLYDFIGSLRRLTDNAFAQQISDPSSQFRIVTRIWRFLTSKKRVGQAHGIDTLLSHRRPGNLIVYCPACPDPHLNMEDNWDKTPDNLRHLQQTRLTADGNHHSNKYSKNTDPDDVSLYDGNSYIPRDQEYKEYLEKLPKNPREKIGPCDHLNALSKQNRKKFKNMDVTGVVCVQCGHIIVRSSVDLQLGEKFANSDYAHVHAIRNSKPPGPMSDIDRRFAKKADRLSSYDIVCGYCINVEDRFATNFPDEAAFVNNTRWLIPLVHVHNHKDSCTYLYSSAYIDGAGHFHGETAEMTWIELNQLAPQTRQMNNGHRHDTMIDHHSYWNWVKTSNMAATLYNEVNLAKTLFLEKHGIFKALCTLYADRLPTWNGMDRRSRIVRGKEVTCVYRQDEKKAPSQTRIYETLLTELTSAEAPSLQLTIPVFLNEALLIRTEQRQIIYAQSSERESMRNHLRKRIDDWRKLQRDLTPQIGDFVARQAVSLKSADCPEKAVLYLPSDFSEAQRVQYDLVTLGENERRFHQGAAYDAIVKIRILRKTINALIARKKAQDRGQKPHTRSVTQIYDLEAACNLQVAEYSATRDAMISLGLSSDDPQFPELTMDDTFRKPTNVKRAIGDSRRHDGGVWVGGARPTASSSSTQPSASEPSMAYSGTQVIHTKRRRSPAAQAKAPPKGVKRRRTTLSGKQSTGNDKESSQPREDGWIWSFKSGKEMSDADLQKWMDDGDRVQWFRAEAEMERWREEWEAKQADFKRCINTFRKMSSVWLELSRSSDNAGKVAYAKRQSAIFGEMERRAVELFKQAGYEHLVTLEDGKILADYILEERLKAEYIIPELVDAQRATTSDSNIPDEYSEYETDEYFSDAEDD